MNDIFKMAQQAYHALSIAESELKRLYKENAELKNSLTKAVEQEREACAKVCEEDESGRDSGGYYAEIIRARGNHD